MKVGIKFLPFISGCNGACGLDLNQEVSTADQEIVRAPYSSWETLKMKLTTERFEHMSRP